MFNICMMDNLYILGICLTITGCCIYNRIPLLENANFYYKKSNRYLQNIYPLKIEQTIALRKREIYSINLMGRRFIVNDTDIDIEAYKILITSLTIPHTPDDILDATITYNDDTECDITDIAKLLIGPHLDQVTASNKDWIIEYLGLVHDLHNIKTIKLQFINMVEITI